MNTYENLNDNNRLAKASLMLGIVSIASIYLLPGVASVIEIFLDAFLGHPL